MATALESEAIDSSQLRPFGFKLLAAHIISKKDNNITDLGPANKILNEILFPQLVQRDSIETNIFLQVSAHGNDSRVQSQQNSSGMFTLDCENQHQLQGFRSQSNNNKNTMLNSSVARRASTSKDTDENSLRRRMQHRRDLVALLKEISSEELASMIFPVSCTKVTDWRGIKGSSTQDFLERISDFFLSGKSGEIHNPFHLNGDAWTRKPNSTLPNVEFWLTLFTAKDCTKYFEKQSRTQEHKRKFDHNSSWSQSCPNSIGSGEPDRQMSRGNERFFNPHNQQNNFSDMAFNGDHNRPSSSGVFLYKDDNKENHYDTSKTTFNPTSMGCFRNTQDWATSLQKTAGIFNETAQSAVLQVTIENREGTLNNIPLTLLNNLDLKKTTSIINKVEVMVQGSTTLAIGSSFQIISIRENSILEVSVYGDDGTEMILHLSTMFFSF